MEDFAVHRLTTYSSVTGALSSSLPVGINPFWKLSFVFKCLTDSVILDDFKTALDRLRAFKITRLGSFAAENGENPRSAPPESANGWPSHEGPGKPQMPLPSPDGDELSHPKLWTNGKPRMNHVEASRRNNPEMSQITESSSEVDVPRNTSDSPILRPQSSWLRDPGGEDYAQAMREVTRSSHSDGPHSEQDSGIGRAR
jgi:hypothetical protein